MPVETIVRPGVVFALWGCPTLADFDKVERLVVEAASSAPGGKVVYVARIPANAPAPDGAVMRHLLSRIGVFKQHCSAYHAILEGSGFGVAMKRGVITTLLQCSQTRHVIFVHARVDSVLKTATKQGLEQVCLVLQEARRKGMLDDAPQALAAH
jgi:hypothetical protein